MRNKNRRKFFIKPRRQTPSDVQLLWGLHTVEAALLNPRREFLRLHATENAWRKLSAAGAGKIQPEIVRPQVLDKMLPDGTVHQGVLLETHPLPSLTLEDMPIKGSVLVLDQVTDPHNVGAILRSAAAFDVSALVMTERYSPETTGVLAKSASGALEYVPLVLVRNLRTALDELRQRGFFVVGLDSEAEPELTALPLRKPAALVLGAEGKGLRQGVREACDALAKLDLPGSIKSLNVSNAAALALFVLHNR